MQNKFINFAICAKYFLVNFFYMKAVIIRKKMINMSDESLIDLKIAFKLYFDYKKEYIHTSIMFFMGIFFLVFVTIFVVLNIIDEDYYQLNELARLVIGLIILVVFCCVLFLLLAFARTIFGLTYDIMTSGELFTEFKRSIIYFKKFWIFFSLFSIPFFLIIFIDQLIGLFFILRFINTNEDYRTFLIPVKVFVYLFDFLTYVLLIEILPSMIAVKKVSQSIKENFQILRSHFRRIFLSIGFYYLIFRGAMFFVDISRLLLVSNEVTFLVFNLIFLVVSFAHVIIGIPILSLISTRIYNTTMMNQESLTVNPVQ